MIVTGGGVIIRTPASGINIYGKDAGGVIIMRLRDGNKIVNFSCSAHDDGQDKQSEEENAEVNGQTSDAQE